jgi:glyoxylase-like metal-dependent hydrolase (beta-lactamase superfamily II)
MKVIRILFIALSVGLALLVAAALYLLDRSEVPEESSYAIDVTALSQAAHETAGELPVRVNHVKVAEATMPRAALFSGFDFSPHTMVHGAYQIVYPDGSYAIIDAGFGPEIFEQMAARGGEARYDEAAFRALAEALPRARLVTITHEHLDHIQGLAEVDETERAQLAAHTFVPAAQLENPQTAELLPGELMDAIEPSRHEGVLGIAPGIAVQPAAGHTPGSQLVYVELQDGSPLLFIGDVAWHMDGIRKLEYRPRLVTDLMLGEDRQAVMAQFRTLHDMLDDLSVTIVSSHDLDQLTMLQRSGAMGSGLEIPGL